MRKLQTVPQTEFVYLSLHDLAEEERLKGGVLGEQVAAYRASEHGLPAELGVQLLHGAIQKGIISTHAKRAAAPSKPGANIPAAYFIVEGVEPCARYHHVSQDLVLTAF
jgi:hypothetical protein